MGRKLRLAKGRKKRKKENGKEKMREFKNAAGRGERNKRKEKSIRISISWGGRSFGEYTAGARVIVEEEEEKKKNKTKKRQQQQQQNGDR